MKAAICRLFYKVLEGSGGLLSRSPPAGGRDSVPAEVWGKPHTRSHVVGVEDVEGEGEPRADGGGEGVAVGGVFQEEGTHGGKV